MNNFLSTDQKAIGTDRKAIKSSEKTNCKYTITQQDFLSDFCNIVIKRDEGKSLLEDRMVMEFYESFLALSISG